MPPSSSLCLRMLPNGSGSNLGQKKLLLSLDFPLCLPWSPGHYLARLFEVRPHRYQEVTERHGSDNNNSSSKELAQFWKFLLTAGFEDAKYLSKKYAQLMI